MSLLFFNTHRNCVLLMTSTLWLIGCSGTGSDDNSQSQPSSNPSSGPSSDPSSSESPVANPAVPDPQVQNMTRVDFAIQVPAYQSNALLLRLSWGAKQFDASWIGDEIWSASDNFPTNTENLLSVTFSDDNGAITLGSFETPYLTGTNTSESFQISAEQFDTEKWDSDGDGTSNLDELIAGTDALNRSPRVLLFSETRGFRHDSIADALQALEELATTAGIETDRAADSAGVFTQEMLANFDAVVWVLTSGDVLDESEQSAFENFIRAGGGYAGIHAASDTEYQWPWYGELVGAYFERHPAIQVATQIVENSSHPSTAHLSSSWTRTDEWYDFNTNPRARVNVLLRLDEDSYTGGGMGDDHPSAWYHEYDGGRSWYTAAGHTVESYSEPQFRDHLLGGLLYVTE